MKSDMVKRLFALVLVVSMALALGACSRALSKLPPLPTPSAQTPVPTQDVFAPPPQAVTEEPQAHPVAPQPTPETAPSPTPVPTPPPTPEPTPTPEDPNIPHLYIRGESYPESMGQGGVAVLYGEIYTDKGVIALVRGRIVDADGNNVQQCLYYPYEPVFNLLGTVNAELVFGLLDPGQYSYVLSAIAENNSFTNGEEILISHPFEIFYP